MCVVTSFYQRPASRVYYFAFFNLRNLLYLILTKQVLNELIDHIDVYEVQGTGKNKTQRLVIYYKFVGYLDIDPTQCHPNYTADIREGVAVEYVSCEPSEGMKELFPEEYGVDDDSFEEEETEQA